MRRIHGVQKGGEPAAGEFIGERTELMIEAVTAGRVDQQISARFQHLCRALYYLNRIIDMLDHIPQSDRVKIIFVALLPKITLDGLFVDLKSMFCPGVLRAAVA